MGQALPGVPDVCLAVPCSVHQGRQVRRCGGQVGPAIVAAQQLEPPGASWRLSGQAWTSARSTRPTPATMRVSDPTPHTLPFFSS